MRLLFVKLALKKWLFV
jgi:hypothetical protein